MQDILPSSSGHGDDSFCTLIFVKFLDNIYVYLVLFLSTPFPHAQNLFLKEKKKYLSVILARNLLHFVTSWWVWCAVRELHFDES